MTDMAVGPTCIALVIRTERGPLVRCYRILANSAAFCLFPRETGAGSVKKNSPTNTEVVIPYWRLFGASGRWPVAQCRTAVSVQWPE